MNFREHQAAKRRNVRIRESERPDERLDAFARRPARILAETGHESVVPRRMDEIPVGGVERRQLPIERQVLVGNAARLSSGVILRNSSGAFVCDPRR